MHSSTKIINTKPFFFFEHLQVISYNKVNALGNNFYRPKVVPTLRYADDSAWTLLSSIDKLIESQNYSKVENNNIGIILISEYGTLDSIKKFYIDAQNSFISPLRFVASNPASIIGLICTFFNFHSSTLNLSVPLSRASSIVPIILKSWFKDKELNFAIVASIEKDNEDFTCKSVLVKKNYDYIGEFNFAPEFFK